MVNHISCFSFFKPTLNSDHQLYFVRMHDPCSSHENAPHRFSTTGIIIGHNFQLLPFESIVIFVPGPYIIGPWYLSLASTTNWLVLANDKLQRDIKTELFLGVLRLSGLLTLAQILTNIFGTPNFGYIMVSNSFSKSSHPFFIIR